MGTAASCRRATSQGDTFAVIHVPAAHDFAAVMVLNPSTQIESGQTFATIADGVGWPVIVAMVEDVLGVRVDDVADLDSQFSATGSQFCLSPPTHISS